MPTEHPVSAPNVVTASTRDSKDIDVGRSPRWWTLEGSERADSCFAVAKHLRDAQKWRTGQCGLYARLYGNQPLWGYSARNVQTSGAYKLPVDRPTLNVVASCTDTLVSRMVQSKPRPMFITSGGDYKRRKVAKDLNNFMDGEFYQVHAYDIGEEVQRDACVLGTGCVKVHEGADGRVKVERVLPTEIFVDEQEARYGRPRQMHQLMLYDRLQLAEQFPDHELEILAAPAAYFDTSPEASRSIADGVMVVESWHLPSGPDADDGKHVIAIQGVELFSEDWESNHFPFVFFRYAPRTLGFWAQGMAERLVGIQTEINKLLYVIHRGIHLMGVPRWLVEDTGGTPTALFDNQIGAIFKYRGTRPEAISPEAFQPEVYAQLERLVRYAYQQEGISTLSAASQKPAGVTSGEALREYDDLQSDRFTSLAQRYERFFEELAYAIYRLSRRIAKRDGHYTTAYPGKTGMLKIDLPGIDLGEEDFAIQCFPTSALSKNPAERKQQIIDLMQGGLLDPQTGRRLLDYPDLKQVEQLLNAAEERTLKYLDLIVEDGEYNPPDPFMPLPRAKELGTAYYNLYVAEGLEEDKQQMLRDWFDKCDELIAQATPPAPQPGMPAPQAAPEPTPTSPIVPNVPGAAPAA